LVVNKIDLYKEEEQFRLLTEWKEMLNFQEYIPLSATKKINTDILFSLIVKYLPEGPPYYPADQLSDRSERFFVSEMIREQIFLLFRDEIPYSCEVAVENFKEAEHIIRIEAHIFVNKKSQKGIIIGKGGQAIKQLGIKSRKQIESFFHKQVHLELFVKVRENWRNDDRQLSRFGYDQ
jgi:GTP-binding protein Era